MTTETKRCCNCDLNKPLDAFNRHDKKPDGRQTFCRECQKANYGANKARRMETTKAWIDKNREAHRGYVRKWRKDNPEVISKINRRYREDNPGMSKKHERRYFERHPGREKVNRMVRKAVQTGRLIKPECCKRCGRSKEPARLDGHHRDYDKPLDVDWLCRQCHVDIHKEERGEAPRTKPAPSFQPPS